MADYLLDTNILILHLRGRKDVTALLTKWSKTGTLHLCSHPHRDFGWDAPTPEQAHHGAAKFTDDHKRR
jgi:hypothetical protein